MAAVGGGGGGVVQLGFSRGRGVGSGGDGGVFKV